VHLSNDVYELWGYPVGTFASGCNRADLVHPEDIERTLAQYREVVSAGGHHLRTELRYRMHDQSYRWYSPYGRVVKDSEPPELIGHLIDIEDRKQVDQEMSQQKAMLEELVVNLRDSEHERTLLYQTGDMLNSAKTVEEACAIAQGTAQVIFPGWSGAISTSDDSGNLTVRDRWGSSVIDRLQAGFGNELCWALRRGRSHLFLNPRRSAPCRHVDCSGEAHATLCVPMVADGKVVGAPHLLADAHMVDGEVMRSVERAERLGETLKLSLSNLSLRVTLQEQAVRDGLTGRYNRSLLAERLLSELLCCQRSGQSLVLAMMDIDHFKRFDYTYGHEAGDLVLHAVARCIGESVRGYDLACRYGGESVLRSAARLLARCCSSAIAGDAADGQGSKPALRRSAPATGYLVWRVGHRPRRVARAADRARRYRALRLEGRRARPRHRRRRRPGTPRQSAGLAAGRRGSAPLAGRMRVCGCQNASYGTEAMPHAQACTGLEDRQQPVDVRMLAGVRTRVIGVLGVEVQAGLRRQWRDHAKVLTKEVVDRQ
jgi:GAF domain-containing protein